MSIFWTIMTLVFTVGVLALVAAAIVLTFAGRHDSYRGEHPTVDNGWRAFSE